MQEVLPVPRQASADVARACGECSECCTHGGVPAIDKLPGDVCPHDCGGCTLFGTPERPQACNDFRCAWLSGVGEEEDRPDKSGVILSINSLDAGGDFAYALECRPNVLWGTGRRIVQAMARRVPLPLIVSLYGSTYPTDNGDLVVVRVDQEHRTKRMKGHFFGILGVGLNVYRLKKTRAA